MAVVDHNLDGFPDVITASQSSHYISVMTNHLASSDPPDPEGFSMDDIECGAGNRDVVSADFNKDGCPDIAVARGNDSLAVFFHDSVDWWDEDYSSQSVVNDPVALAVFDKNLDGFPETGLVL